MMIYTDYIPFVFTKVSYTVGSVNGFISDIHVESYYSSF